MKIYVSYFYMIRFFNKNLIPLSTAIWDPKWYHDFKGQEYYYRDDNGVINGLRCDILHPEPHNDICMHCKDENGNKQNSPDDCSFLKVYMEQLRRIPFPEFYKRLESYCDIIHNEFPDIENPDIVLIVHEAPDNPCSERSVLFKWFEENGHKIEEWNKDQ